jgi:hypothetical protein
MQQSAPGRRCPQSRYPVTLYRLADLLGSSEERANAARIAKLDIFLSRPKAAIV